MKNLNKILINELKNPLIILEESKDKYICTCLETNNTIMKNKDCNSFIFATTNDIIDIYDTYENNDLIKEHKINRLNNDREKLYTLTRTDISIEQQAIQANHSAAQYTIEHNPHKTGDWNNGSIINLALGSEKSLRKWIRKLIKLDIKFSIFREPDMNNEITSISILHKGDIFKGIPLLLKTNQNNNKALLIQLAEELGYTLSKKEGLTND
jgi:hypothetical protein